MNRRSVFLVACLLFVAASTASTARADVWERPYPWTEAGLSDEEAAAYVLDRLAYGARPGDVYSVLRLGIDAWIEGQLAGDLPGTTVELYAARRPVLGFGQEQLQRTYATEHDILQEALSARRFDLEDWNGGRGEHRRRTARRALERFTAEQGFRPQKDLAELIVAQKVYRAAHSESQLVEILTDFWFNHFNVSIQSPRTLYYTLPYERDAIRPNVLGDFRTLLGATARHPAMLSYLGNADSVADQHRTTLLDLEMTEPLDNDLSPGADATLEQRLAHALGWRDPQMRMRRSGQDSGLNENYARELLELHTLGVDGGYGQRDVIELARVFTGWSILPRIGYRNRLTQMLDGAHDLGFIHQEDFLFRPDHHDAEEKYVLGVHFPAGGGIDEGERALDLLARHPSTRTFISGKLAQRFVSDRPPPALVRRLAEVWELTDGDLRQVMRALIASPEFWAAARDDSRKIKSPLEFAVSAVRALGAELQDPVPLTWWISRSGQPLYACAPPTGYSEESDAWMSVGTLRERMQFSMSLADGGIRGTKVDVLSLLRGGEPGTLDEALRSYRPLLLPHRPVAEDSFWDRLERRLQEEEERLAAEALDEEVDEAALAPAHQAHLRRLSRRFATHAVGLLFASPDFQTK